MSDFTEVVNSDLAKAIDGDREHLYTSNEDLWNEHDEFLNDEYDRLHYAIEDVSEHFRKELKKIYGFGGDVRSNYSATGTRADKGKNGTGYGSGQETHAPYTKHQHDQFLWKFKHYHGAQLAAMDASIENLWVFLDSRVVVRSGEAAVQANSLQNEITAEAKNIRDALLDTGDNLIQNKAEVAAIEHENLIEERIVVAAEANARADELRKEILYAVHVLRYAGGAGLHTVNHQL
jgi:D-ribose pyranose/furanose isomerase RbsD